MVHSGVTYTILTEAKFCKDCTETSYGSRVFESMHKFLWYVLYSKIKSFEKFKNVREKCNFKKRNIWKIFIGTYFFHFFVWVVQ